jgi:hypothetical protein
MIFNLLCKPLNCKYAVMQLAHKLKSQSHFILQVFAAQEMNIFITQH